MTSLTEDEIINLKRLSEKEEQRIAFADFSYQHSMLRTPPAVVISAIIIATIIMLVAVVFFSFKAN